MQLKRAEKQKEATECLYQFKKSDCNPYSLADDCHQIVDCITDIKPQDKPVELTFSVLQLVSMSIRDTMMAPALIFIALIAWKLKRQL